MEKLPEQSILGERAGPAQAATHTINVCVAAGCLSLQSDAIKAALETAAVEHA